MPSPRNPAVPHYIVCERVRPRISVDFKPALPSFSCLATRGVGPPAEFPAALPCGECVRSAPPVVFSNVCFFSRVPHAAWRSAAATAAPSVRVVALALASRFPAKPSVPAMSDRQTQTDTGSTGSYWPTVRVSPVCLCGNCAPERAVSRMLSASPHRGTGIRCTGSRGGGSGGVLAGFPLLLFLVCMSWPSLYGATVEDEHRCRPPSSSGDSRPPRQSSGACVCVCSIFFFPLIYSAGSCRSSKGASHINNSNNNSQRDTGLSRRRGRVLSLSLYTVLAPKGFPRRITYTAHSPSLPRTEGAEAGAGVK